MRESARGMELHHHDESDFSCLRSRRRKRKYFQLSFVIISFHFICLLWNANYLWICFVFVFVFSFIYLFLFVLWYFSVIFVLWITFQYFHYLFHSHRMPHLSRNDYWHWRRNMFLFEICFLTFMFTLVRISRTRWKMCFLCYLSFLPGKS